jgi:hypothetical protein
MFIVCSIVLMIVWLFLIPVFEVPVWMSAAILTVAFSLFGFDWWLQSRAQRTL